MSSSWPTLFGDRSFTLMSSSSLMLFGDRSLFLMSSPWPTLFVDWSFTLMSLSGLTLMSSSPLTLFNDWSFTLVSSSQLTQRIRISYPHIVYLHHLFIACSFTQTLSLIRFLPYLSSIDLSSLQLLACVQCTVLK